MAQATQTRQVPVQDSRGIQARRQAVLIELRIAPRAWHGPHIHQLPDAVVLQNTKEILDRMRGVTHREEPHLFKIRSRAASAHGNLSAYRHATLEMLERTSVMPHRFATLTHARTTRLPLALALACALLPAQQQRMDEE